MSVFSKIGSFFSIRDDEEELYEDEVPSGRVVPLSSAGRRGGIGRSTTFPGRRSAVTWSPATRRFFT